MEQRVAGRLSVRHALNDFLLRKGGHIGYGVLPAFRGRGIAKRMLQLSDDVLTVQQGSLYPALHRLEHQGWITAEWKPSEHGRNAKFYALTREGRQQLEREMDSWKRLSSAVALLLKRA